MRWFLTKLYVFKWTMRLSTPEDKLDIAKIRPLAHLGYYEYTSITGVFEIKGPGASDSTTAGLESKTG